MDERIVSRQQQAKKHIEEGDELTWGLNAKPESAIEQYHLALQLDPSSEIAHWRIGQVHLFAEPPRLDAALQAFQYTIRVNPEWAEGYLCLAITLSELGQDEEAISEYQASMRLAPEDSRAPISLGSCLAKLERFSEAVIAYQIGIALNPPYGEIGARMMLAEALKNNNQLPEAVSQWQIVAGMKSVWDYEEGEPERAASLVSEFGSQTDL